MATMDRTVYGLAIDDRELPQFVIDELLDHGHKRGAESNRAFSGLIADEPLGGEKNEPATEDTVLRSDEVTREAVSFARGPVVIKVTDEEAQQLLRFHGGTGPPQ